MHTEGPLDASVTSISVVGGATWGLRNGFDVAPRSARAPHARPRARPFPVTARFGHPLLENRFPQHLFGMLSLGEVGRRPNFRRHIPFWYVFWTSQKSGSSYELGLRLRTIAAGCAVQVQSAISAHARMRTRARARGRSPLLRVLGTHF